MGAAASVLTAAFLFSFTPVLVHLTARDSNQFYYNTIILLPQFIPFALFLFFTKHRFLDRHLHSNFQFNSMFTKDKKLMLIVMVVGVLDYAFFVWSTKFIETAVTSTIYEMWPALTVYGLARYRQSDDRRKSQSVQSQTDSYSITTEQKFLVMFATVGLLFMLGSQTTDDVPFFEIPSSESTIGIGFALLAAILGAAHVVGSIAYGETLYHELPKKQVSTKSELLLWVTLLGLMMSRLIAGLISLVLGFITSSSGGFPSTSIMRGAMLIAVTNIVGVILLRVGNLRTLSQANPAINALIFISPGVALVWLMQAGITLPRFDLFIVGAALIIATNVLMHLKPDEVRDASKHSKEATRSTRLGFTALIMSIWVFGTFIYTRDEIMPSSWIVSSTDDYWSLVALSATVFALMLGFRVARLTTRISQEDEAMFRIFRDSEHLVRNGILTKDIRKNLAELDTAPPSKLLEAYRTVREDIISGMSEAQTHEDKEILLSIETRLDSITHSKQQGRDIVELLSLTAFAVVTIGLGLLLRQKGLQLDPLQPSWSGFVSEIFILLFVSTVAFLCINLFDIRRERQTPLLLIPAKTANADERYELFFRYKKHLRARHIMAILICMAMSAVFCGLLADKWL